MGQEKKRSNGEAKLQVAYVNWVRLALPHVLSFHVYNENAINEIQGKIRKDRGVVAGVHDNHLIWPGNYATLELKDPDKPYAKYSPKQRDFADHMDRCGFKHACCQNGKEIEAALRSWGLEPLYPFPVALQGTQKQMMQMAWAYEMYRQ